MARSTGQPAEGGSAPPRIEVALAPAGEGSRCNNGCLECVAAPARSSPPAALAGRHLLVRDREPLLRRDLPARIAALRRDGAASVRVLTNGRLLAFPALLRPLLAAGVDAFVVKLFALDGAAHDAHTRVPGSFDQARAGIAAARALGAEVLATFPRARRDPAQADAAHRAAVARALTGLDPVELEGTHLADPPGATPEHGWRFEVVRRRGPAPDARWARAPYPLAHVFTGPECNARCVYCDSRGGETPGRRSAEEIERTLGFAAAHLLGSPAGESPTAVLIGGEPTLHPELPRLVRRARDLGFPRVMICTNGTRLREAGALDRLVDAGLTDVQLSLHDHRPEVAGALAGAPALGPGYPEVAAALLARPELRTHLFRILLRGTLDALPAYLEFLAAHDRTGRGVPLALALPTPRGRMLDAPALFPRLDALRPAVAAAVARGDALGVDVLLHHAPACLLPEHPERHACWQLVTEQVEPLGAGARPAPSQGDTRRGPACDGCAGADGRCPGLPAACWDEGGAAAWVTPQLAAPGERPAREGRA